MVVWFGLVQLILWTFTLRIEYLIIIVIIIIFYSAVVSPSSPHHLVAFLVLILHIFSWHTVGLCISEILLLLLDPFVIVKGRKRVERKGLKLTSWIGCIDTNEMNVMEEAHLLGQSN